MARANNRVKQVDIFSYPYCNFYIITFATVGPQIKSKLDEVILPYVTKLFVSKLLSLSSNYVHLTSLHETAQNTVKRQVPTIADNMRLHIKIHFSCKVGKIESSRKVICYIQDLQRKAGMSRLDN